MLARFRADPKKIRVSMHQHGEHGWWCVTVGLRTGQRSIAAAGPNPEVALEEALEAAERHNFDGIDLEMQWSYEHPWKVD